MKFLRNLWYRMFPNQWAKKNLHGCEPYVVPKSKTTGSVMHGAVSVHAPPTKIKVTSEGIEEVVGG